MSGPLQVRSVLSELQGRRIHLQDYRQEVHRFAVQANGVPFVEGLLQVPALCLTGSFAKYPLSGRPFSVQYGQEILQEKADRGGRRVPWVKKGPLALGEHLLETEASFCLGGALCFAWVCI